MAKTNNTKPEDQNVDNKATEETSVDVLEVANKTAEEIVVKEEPVYEDFEDLLESEISIDPDKMYQFELTKQGVTKYIFPTEQTIYDPIAQRQRVIRYVKSSKHIYKEFQDDVVAEASTYNPIVFQCPAHLIKKGAKAKLDVSGKDKNLIKYLLMCGNIEGSRTSTPQSGNKIFKMIDTAKIAREKLSSMELRYRAIDIARAMEATKLKSIAYVLGINGKDFEDLKVALFQKIEADPSAFLQLADDPTTARKYLIKKALDNAVITSTLHPNQLYWVDSNAKITNLDPSQDAISYIAAFTFTKEGEEFFNILRRRIS